MHKLLALALASACSVTCAQTPATNPMPDGSRDMYVGLGLVSAPRYEGAQDRKQRALPVFQVQFSNGFFVSGMNAGMHLSRRPSLEFGPLLALQPGRSSAGTAGEIGDPVGVRLAPPSLVRLPKQDTEPLAGMESIHARLQYGAFLNYYLTPSWRATSSLLWGAGNARDGGKLELGVQRVAMALGPHHRMSLAAGLTLANGNYQRAFFGVSDDEAMSSMYPAYRPGGGLMDASLAARWNWALTPSWLLTSSVKATRLLGSANDSPLVERPTNLTVSTAVAYRF
jgi:outer membrane scaffolding protein for murein synthesis (MipA/OmpV family)